MKIDYRSHTSGVDWSELEALFRADGLGGRAGDKLRRAFEQSQAVCFAYAGDRLVGVSRALSDGEYHTLIYTVADIAQGGTPQARTATLSRYVSGVWRAWEASYAAIIGQWYAQYVEATWR